MGPFRFAKHRRFKKLQKLVAAFPETAEVETWEHPTFRVRGKIFVTVPPEKDRLRVFISEDEREAALATYPECVEELQWGKKIVGIEINLAAAKAPFVKELVRLAWEERGGREN